MANDVQYNLLFNVNGTQVTAAVNKLGQGVNAADAAVVKLGVHMDGALKKIQAGVSQIRLSSVLDQVDRVARGFDALSKPGTDLSTNMYDLQAITGVAGQKLKDIEGYARAAAKQFGGSAADNVESYKLILSKLNPEIAKTPAALNSMGNSVSTLSKTMGGDAVAATDVLTTAMNQYQVSTDDPIAASKIMAEMMNIMAAGAKEGSAELPEIKSALEQAGMAAKGAGVSFAETNAAIQVLDKAGKKGSEGGVAIRNVLATLSEGRFLPKEVQAELTKAGVSIQQLGNNSIPLAQRLKTLQPIMNDSALVTKLFGKENSNAAVALMSGIPEMERLTSAVTGTSTAYEQAAIVMESPAEKNKRLQASVDDLKISLFNGTNGWLGYASVVGDATQTVTNMWPAVSLLGKSIAFVTNAEKMNALWLSVVSVATTVWTGITAALSATMWGVPIVWIVAAVIALITVIGYVIYKTDGWGKAWDHTVKGAKYLWEAFTSTAKLHWDVMVNGIMVGLNYIKAGWYEFQNAVGIGDEAENNSMLTKISADTDARKKQIADETKATIGLYAKSAGEFKAAAGSLTWNSKRDPKKEIAAAVGMPGAGTTTGTPGISFGAGKGGKVGKATNDAIATGGTKNTTVNITIGNQIGTFTITTANLKEGTEKLRDLIIDEMTRAVAMGAALGNG
jgi:TP901 family phage tail tape measure protein